MIAEFGDLVIAHCGQHHDIYPVSEGSGRRLVVGFEDSNHELKGVTPSRQFKPDDSLQPPNRFHTSFRYMLARHGTDAN